MTENKEEVLQKEGSTLQRMSSEPYLSDFEHKEYGVNNRDMLSVSLLVH